MSREIKFRGKRVDNGEWVYDYYVKELCGTVYILADEGDQWDSRAMLTLVEVEEETVGQFTGRKDANRVEIYEGDKVVIRDDYEEIGIIVWDNEELEYVIKTETLSLKMGCFYASELEVIGNIHESEG